MKSYSGDQTGGGFSLRPCRSGSLAGVEFLAINEAKRIIVTILENFGADLQRDWLAPFWLLPGLCMFSVYISLFVQWDISLQVRVCWLQCWVLFDCWLSEYSWGVGQSLPCNMNRLCCGQQGHLARGHCPKGLLLWVITSGSNRGAPHCQSRIIGSMLWETGLWPSLRVRVF